MSPALNGSSGLQCFKCSNAVKICNRIMFDSYPGLPHICLQYYASTCAQEIVQSWNNIMNTKVTEYELNLYCSRKISAVLWCLTPQTPLCMVGRAPTKGDMYLTDSPMNITIEWYTTQSYYDRNVNTHGNIYYNYSCCTSLLVQKCTYVPVTIKWWYYRIFVITRKHQT